MDQIHCKQATGAIQFNAFMASDLQTLFMFEWRCIYHSNIDFIYFSFFLSLVTHLLAILIPTSYYPTELVYALHAPTNPFTCNRCHCSIQVYYLLWGSVNGDISAIFLYPFTFSFRIGFTPFLCVCLCSSFQIFRLWGLSTHGIFRLYLGLQTSAVFGVIGDCIPLQHLVLFPSISI